MSATMHETRSRIPGDSENRGMKWSHLGQNRLDRLLELRAVVASLRAEREHELLADLRMESRELRPRID